MEKSKRNEEEHRRGINAGSWKTHRSSHVTLTRPSSSCPLKMTPNNNGQSQSQSQRPPSSTRSKKKRKLRHVHQDTPKQGGEESNHDDLQTNIELRSIEISNLQLPEKQVLELVLDVLQRRDVHEIFAEPVDPDEVEDYYEIIKEPMDFGTMRAKLHEGMYTDLGQFENDVFFITKNAMHFNPSATIYFRQARAIDELAVRVFRVLKTQPERLESEFSESRRRNTRRSQDEAWNSLNKTRPKMARKKSSNSLINEPSKTMTRSSNTKNIRRRNPIRNRNSASVPCSDAINHEVSCGDGDDRGSRSNELDRRGMYKPQMSHLDEDESIISTLSCNKNQLERINQQDIGYRESLMSFVKDLGPVIQTIAHRKLVESVPVQNCQIPSSSKTSCLKTTTPDRTITAPRSWNFMDQVDTFTTNSSRRNDLEEGENKGKTLKEDKIAEDSTKFNGEKELVRGTMWWNVQNRSDITISNHSFPLAKAGELSSSSFARSKIAENKPTLLIDQAKSDNAASKLDIDFVDCYLRLPSFGHNEASTTKSSLGFLTHGDKVKFTQGLIHEATSTADLGQTTTPNRCKPWKEMFQHEKPSLEARFGQLSAFGQRTFLQQSSTSAVNFFDV